MAEPDGTDAFEVRFEASSQGDLLRSIDHMLAATDECA
jgi:hypothetical protein